jgi:hypothetical protein
MKNKTEFFKPIACVEMCNQMEFEFLYGFHVHVYFYYTYFHAADLLSSWSRN